MDSASIKAKKGDQPSARARQTVGAPELNATIDGSKRNTAGVRSLGANMHDSAPLSILLDAVTPVAGRLGRPRQRPRKLHADKATTLLVVSAPAKDAIFRLV